MQIIWIIATFYLGVAVYAVNGQYQLLEFQGYLRPKIDQNSFTLEDVKNLLYKKCRKAILSGTFPTQIEYENIEKAAHKLINCTNTIANVSAVLVEIEEARPTGDLDLVFHKYCSRAPQAKQCLKEFNEHLLVCLTPAERDQNSIIMHIITTLLDFACHKNGDQIALFIAEEGPECLEANKENISNCMNATFGAYIPAIPPTELPELVMGPKQCIDLHDFEECILSYVEHCNEVTPANIIESLFRYVKNETKCQEEIEKVIGVHGPNVQLRNMAAIDMKILWIMYGIISLLMFVVN